MAYILRNAVLLFTLDELLTASRMQTLVNVQGCKAQQVAGTTSQQVGKIESEMQVEEAVATEKEAIQ
jgi:hypothetical protein